MEADVDALNLVDVETVDFDGFSADCLPGTRLDPFSLPGLSFLLRLSFLALFPFAVVLEANLG